VIYKYKKTVIYKRTCDLQIYRLWFTNIQTVIYKHTVFDS